MIRCEISVSVEKRIGSYNEFIPDLRRNNDMRIQLNGDTVEELKECLANTVNTLIDKLDEFSEKCDFDTDIELEAYMKHCKVNFGDALNKES